MSNNVKLKVINAKVARYEDKKTVLYLKETAGFTNIKFSDLEVVASGYLRNNTNKNVYFKETTLTEYIAVNGRLPLEYIKWFILN